MRMATFRTCLGAGFLAFVGLLGCGGGGDPDGDPGLVFRATGFVRGPENLGGVPGSAQISCTQPTVENAIADTAFAINLETTRFFPDRGSLGGNPCGGYMGLVNALSQMALNVEEIAVRYEIPGAAIAIPENSITVSVQINPSGSEEDAASGQTNLVYSQLLGQMLPEQMIAFLNLNANDLPSVPYAMNAYFQARGRAVNGARYTTNEVGYQFTITR